MAYSIREAQPITLQHLHECTSRILLKLDRNTDEKRESNLLTVDYQNAGAIITSTAGASSMYVYSRTFARKFSNIDFLLKILPLKDDELVMPET